VKNQSPETTPEQAFGQLVRAAREQHGWSQRDLVQRLANRGLNLTQSQVAKTENGKRPIRLDEAVAIARMFGQSLEDFMASRARVCREVVLAANNVLHAVEDLQLRLGELVRLEQERDLNRDERAVIAEAKREARASATTAIIPGPPLKRRK
jgi:transcriptional regulator with XRE-family HTH domain